MNIKINTHYLKQFSSMLCIRNRSELAIPMWHLWNILIYGPELWKCLNHRPISLHRKKYLPKEIFLYFIHQAQCWDTWRHSINDNFDISLHFFWSYLLNEAWCSISLPANTILPVTSKEHRLWADFFRVNLIHFLTIMIFLLFIQRGHLNLVLQICLVWLFWNHFSRFVLTVHILTNTGFHCQ